MGRFHPDGAAREVEMGMTPERDIGEMIAASSVGTSLADIEERGIDAHLADLEVAPKKKRKKSTSPTARTLAECRKRGWPAGVVEKFVRFPPPGHHVDLFGVLDVVALATDSTGRGQCTYGIQACAGADHGRRRAKILAEPRARQWVEAGNRLELWSWSRRVARNHDGSKSKRPRWTLRVETYEQMRAAAPEEASEE